MSPIVLLAKHPHGRMTVIDPLDPHTAPPPVPAAAGRRPVVALVDAAVGSHPWLETPTTVTLLTFPREAEPEEPLEPAESPSEHEAPVTEHGTFDAGIIRQLAPGAEILSAAVLRNDRTIAHADVLSALDAIHERVRAAAEGFVDVICLPFGYLAGETTEEHREEERGLLVALARCGVLIVAAAGNAGTSDKIYPAAFAPELLVEGHLMLSVGALDLTGCPAAYSSYGPWVTHWETGLTSSIVADAAGGYAVGEGTSFAATRLAAKLAAILLDDPTLSDVKTPAANERAGRTVARLA